MTLSDLANPSFYTALFDVLAPMSRHAAAADARRRSVLLAQFSDDEAADFEDTRPCRWLLTEPPASELQHND